MPSDIGVRIRAARMRRNLSIDEVTMNTGISTNLWEHYELGRVPDFTTLGRIAGVLDVDIADLLGEPYIVITELQKLREEVAELRSAVENMRGGRGVRP